MSVDLSTQIERYVAAVAADQEEISVAEVQPPLPVIGERSSPPSRDRRSVGRGVVVAVAAAVVLLVLVGGVAWLTRSDNTEPATPTTTSAPPETTSSTLIPAPRPGGLWSPVEIETPEGVPRLDGLFDVAETPVGLLATSFDGLWISQDAVEWRPYARDSVEFDVGVFSRIAASNLGIVVAPAVPEDGGPWFSPDGVEWTLIEGLRLFPFGLTASNEGFLAIDEDGGVVSSTDGTTWRTVKDLPDADFHLVAATPLGFYAAQDTRIWRSPDGVEWTQLPTTSLDGEVTSIAGTQTGLVAVTRAPTENLPDWSTFESRFWHTTDGTIWTEVQLRPQGNGEGAHVSASESGFFALSGGPWFSEDGRLWAPVTTGRGERGCCMELIPFQDGFVGVTDAWGGGTFRTQSGEWRTAVVWRYKP